MQAITRPYSNQIPSGYVHDGSVVLRHCAGILQFEFDVNHEIDSIKRLFEIAFELFEPEITQWFADEGIDETYSEGKVSEWWGLSSVMMYEMGLRPIVAYHENRCTLTINW